MTTIRDVLIKYSSRNIDSLDLELLISYIIHKSREFVLAHPEKKISTTNIQKLTQLIERRIKGEPLAYILGEKEFYGLKFKVNKNVLVPRPETELIVDLTLKFILGTQHKTSKTKIIDIGTGSGNIIISIVKTIEHAQLPSSNLYFLGIDISDKALITAKQNARLHQVYNKIKFIKGDLLSSLIQNSRFKIQDSKIIILANLPYLNAKWKNLLKSNDSKSLNFEPKLAFKGGFDGLDIYRRLANQIKLWKNKNKPELIHLFCEIDCTQKDKIKKIFSFAHKIKLHQDLSQKWRVCEIEI